MTRIIMEQLKRPTVTMPESRPWRGKRLWLVIGVLLLGLVHSGIAGNEVQQRPLPRGFQGVKLGMTLSDVLRLKPDIAITKRTNFATVSLIATPRDRYVQRVVYRFHENTLYEMEIRYRPDRLQRGVSGLLSRLREEYGAPKVERLDEVDYEEADLNRKRTAWEDARTRIALLEREYLRDGNSVTEITLTMTDLALQRRRDEAHEEQVHRKMQEVPIPHLEA
jgi:hypothetical protein